MSKKKLEECCVSISDGDHMPPPKSVDGIPFLTISNIDENNHLNFADTMFVSKDYWDKIDEKRKARRGDVLLSVTGSYGIPVYIDFEKEFVFQRHIAILKPDEKVLSGKYLYYLLKAPTTKRIMDKLVTGAIQKTLGLDMIRNMSFDIPSIPEQNRIVEILSKIDALIDNNIAICSNLERTAKLLYDYWFNQFDFSDSNGFPYKSSGGKMEWSNKLKREIPEGWLVGTLNDIASVVWGQCPDGKDIIDKATQGKDVIDYCSGAGDMRNGFIVDCQAKTYTSTSRRMAHKNAVLLSVAGSIGAMCIADHDISLGRAAVAFEPKDSRHNMFIYNAIKTLSYQVQHLATGSIQKVINSDHIGTMYFAYNQEILNLYGEKSWEIYKQILNCTVVNRELYSLRDFLLPMLMNGQIKIEA